MASSLAVGPINGPHHLNQRLLLQPLIRPLAAVAMEKAEHYRGRAQATGEARSPLRSRRSEFGSDEQGSATAGVELGGTIQGGANALNCSGSSTTA